MVVENQQNVSYSVKNVDILEQNRHCFLESAAWNDYETRVWFHSVNMMQGGIIIIAVKRLIVINHIQNKSFWLHNICECAVYMYYVYINTHTCMYIFKKYICLYIKYIDI